MADAPSAFIRHTKLALNLLRRYAIPRRGEHVHDIEPFLQRRAAALEGRSGHRVNVMAAPRAAIGGQFGKPQEAPMLLALRTIYLSAVSHLHQMLKAGGIIGEACEKLLNIECLSHLIGLLYPKYREPKSVRQWDICALTLSTVGPGCPGLRFAPPGYDECEEWTRPQHLTPFHKNLSSPSRTAPKLQDIPSSRARAADRLSNVGGVRRPRR
ncbi:hypothetical protein MnTg02_00138 [bacterium MnTg02]|nr:hypothetical protein MnTg02_00138 [bacterium MnTg02]